jgi:hypothetical protein
MDDGGLMMVPGALSAENDEAAVDIVERDIAELLLAAGRILLFDPTDSIDTVAWLLCASNKTQT